MNFVWTLNHKGYESNRDAKSQESVQENGLPITGYIYIYIYITFLTLKINNA